MAQVPARRIWQQAGRGCDLYGSRRAYTTPLDLVNPLEEEKAQGRAGALARQLTQLDGVILDELVIYPSRIGELCYSI